MDYKNLIEKAQNAMQNSYSPYSNFKVGACVLTKNGKTFVGTNVENASFGGTICAERNALNQAISCGENEIVAIVIVSSSGELTYPCGICRQAIVEFGKNIKVIVAKNTEEYKEYSISELLPFSFSKEDIR